MSRAMIFLPVITTMEQFYEEGKKLEDLFTGML
jgi:hypothetical protein